MLCRAVVEATMFWRRTKHGVLSEASRDCSLLVRLVFLNYIFFVFLFFTFTFGTRASCAVPTPLEITPVWFGLSVCRRFVDDSSAFATFVKFSCVLSPYVFAVTLRGAGGGDIVFIQRMNEPRATMCSVKCPNSLGRLVSFIGVSSSQTRWTWQSSAKRRRGWAWKTSPKLSLWTKFCNRWGTCEGTEHGPVSFQDTNPDCWASRCHAAPPC